MASDKVERVHLYQSLDSLLMDLTLRLTSFIKAQAHYVLSRRTTTDQPPPHGALVFNFDGEFSIVADPAGGEVASRIETLRSLIGQVLGLQFT